MEGRACESARRDSIPSPTSSFEIQHSTFDIPPYPLSPPLPDGPNTAGFPEPPTSTAFATHGRRHTVRSIACRFPLSGWHNVRFEKPPSGLSPTWVSPHGLALHRLQVFFIFPNGISPLDLPAFISRRRQGQLHMPEIPEIYLQGHLGLGHLLSRDSRILFQVL